MKGILKALEIGHLITDSKDENYNIYNDSYDHKYGYDYTSITGYKNEDTIQAIEAAKSWIKNKTDNVYAIITNQGEFEYLEPFDCEYLDEFNFKYDLSKVEYSIAKINNEVIENFIQK